MKNKITGPKLGALYKRLKRLKKRSNNSSGDLSLLSGYNTYKQYVRTVSMSYINSIENSDDKELDGIFKNQLLANVRDIFIKA